MTADPYKASAGASDPGSWNRYAYTGGDPINRTDRMGLDWTNNYAYEAYAEGSMTPGQAEAMYGEANYCAYTGSYCPSGDGSGCYANSFYGGGGCYGPDPAPDPPPPPPPPAPPTCADVLAQSLQSFLQRQDPALLGWDPNLAVDLLVAAKSADIDPRLMASIVTLESGHGKVFGGQNNPFGLGPGNSYPTPQAAVLADASSLKRFIYTYGETSVSQLYSGNGNVVDSRRPWIVYQRVAYCYGSTPAEKAKCQAAGDTVSGFLSSFTGSQAVGLRPGDPNNLSYPCN